MVVDTAMERCSGIAPDVLGEKMATARMLVKESRNIMNEPRNKD
jgi:hypothetical protein